MLALRDHLFAIAERAHVVPRYHLLRQLEHAIDDLVARRPWILFLAAADEQSGNLLEKLLVIGKDFTSARLREIASEALGRTLNILRPEDVGLNLPASNLKFDELAAPAGLATLGWR